MRKRRGLIIFSSFSHLFLIFFSSFVIGYGEDIPRPKPVPKQILFQGTTYAAYSGSELLWELHADRVEGTSLRAKVTPVHAKLYRKGKLRYWLESTIAFINPTTTDVFFPKGAILKSPTGEEVNVPLLLWKSTEKKFVGTKGVKVRHGNTLLEGDHMTLDQNYATVKLDGHVKARFIP